MKTKVLLWVTFLFILSSCKDDDSNLTEWHKLESSPYKSIETTFAVHGNKCYVMYGFNKSVDLSSYGYGYSNEIWAYDLVNNTWESKGVGLGSGRSQSLSFTIDENIYVIGGVYEKSIGSYDFVYLDELLKFNPSLNTWTELVKFPGAGRLGGIVQVHNKKAYYGLGAAANEIFRDFWMFEPSSGEWTKLADFPGGLIGSGVSFDFASFLFNNEIVVITGKTASEPEMWSYNILTNEWKQITELNFADTEVEGLLRCKTRCVSATYKGKGYLTLGKWASAPYDVFNSNVYEYTPETSTWKTVGMAPNEISTTISSFSAVVDDGIIFGTEYPFETWKYRPKE